MQPGFVLDHLSQTKDMMKEQSLTSNLAYSVLIDSIDSRGRKKGVSIVFTNLFLKSSLKSTGKRAIVHYEGKQTMKNRIKINLRPA